MEICEPRDQMGTADWVTSVWGTGDSWDRCLGAEGIPTLGFLLSVSVSFTGKLCRLRGHVTGLRSPILRKGRPRAPCTLWVSLRHHPVPIGVGCWGPISSLSSSSKPLRKSWGCRDWKPLMERLVERRALGLARLSPQGGDLSALAPPWPLLCSRPWLLFRNLFTAHLVSAVLWGFLVNTRGAVLPPRPTQPSETHGPTEDVLRCLGRGAPAGEHRCRDFRPTPGVSPAEMPEHTPQQKCAEDGCLSQFGGVWEGCLEEMRAEPEG